MPLLPMLQHIKEWSMYDRRGCISSYRFRQQEQFCCLSLWVTVPLTSRMWIVIIFKKERGSNEIGNRSKEVVRQCKAENADGF